MAGHRAHPLVKRFTWLALELPAEEPGEERRRNHEHATSRVLAVPGGRRGRAGPGGVGRRLGGFAHPAPRDQRSDLAHAFDLGRPPHRTRRFQTAGARGSGGGCLPRDRARARGRWGRVNRWYAAPGVDLRPARGGRLHRVRRGARLPGIPGCRQRHLQRELRRSEVETHQGLPPGGNARGPSRRRRGDRGRPGREVAGRIPVGTRRARRRAHAGLSRHDPVAGRQHTDRVERHDPDRGLGERAPGGLRRRGHRQSRSTR